ncbi:Cell death protease [Coemansia brasiliensis]|uniref:Pheromone-processing carboxypeptidase KEX1 n=1 Tax=Coemansia brasiliensis TaxID=2650707 RepID=A0A9W8M0P9_9FUNG|nr:Cell death protease [Coemansia brasiliensis]
MSSANTTISLPSQSDLKVSSVPFADDPAFDSLEQYAGQLPMGTDDLMFFWLVKNTTNQENRDKLLIWLNGGPGCTSLDGILMENGPFKFAKGNKLEVRPYSLSQQFDVLYIDQPFGTGYSTAPTEHYQQTFKNATSSLMEFLDRFYQVFPLLRQRQLFLSGESEAGTYIPYLAHALLQNKTAEGPELGGLMIGNGWVDPYPMYMSYAELLRQHDMLTDKVHTNLLQKMDRCTREFNRAPQPVHTEVCESIASVFLDDGRLDSGMCYNQYDLRLTDTYPSCGMNWPPEVGIFTDYLNRKDVQHALNVHKPPSSWTECNNEVNRRLRHDASSPASLLMPDILAQVPVLYFVGAEDYLCNYVGTEWSIGNMTWAGNTGFSDSSYKSTWSINGDSVGVVTADRGLTYALVYNASHMVGFDKPREVLDLFTYFTNSSARNLNFRSSLYEKMPSNSTDNHHSESSVTTWVGIGLFVASLISLLVCFIYRKQLFAWWVKRRSRYDSIRPIEDGFVGTRGQRLDDLNDAFVMSEFMFKSNSRDSLDIDGLLLDDEMASSPDEDAPTHTSSNPNRQTRNNA